MKTNTLTATNEGQAVQGIRVQFAPETAVRIELRQQPLIAWVPRRPAVVASAPRPAMALVLTLGDGDDQ